MCAKPAINYQIFQFYKVINGKFATAYKILTEFNREILSLTAFR